MLDKKLQGPVKWDVWKLLTSSKKKEQTNKDIFIENWKQIQVYYYKGFLNVSKPISQTGLKHNLKQLSKCIINDTVNKTNGNKLKSYNPDGCLEYFIEKQIAVKLVDYATKNIPIGMHLEVLKLFEQLLSCETIFLNLFPELNFRTTFHNLLLLSLNFPRQIYSSKNTHDPYEEIKVALIKLINAIFYQLINNPSYISFFYNNKKIFNESGSSNNCQFLLSADTPSQFLIFDIFFKIYPENVKSLPLYDQTVLLAMDLLNKLESIQLATSQIKENFNNIYKTNKRNDLSLLRFSDIVDSQHITCIEEEILLYILNKSSLFEAINEQFALLYAASIVNIPETDNREIDLHNIMNIYMYQQNISFHPKHSKHILKSYISTIKSKYPILKTNYSNDINEYNEQLLSYWTFINIILERAPKCVFWKYLEKFEQYIIDSFILLDFQNDEFGLNSTICLNDLYCKSNIPKLKELLFLIIWKNQDILLKRINQNDDKILSYETLKLVYNIMSGYDYYIYRYLISNFIIDNKNIYNLEKYKNKEDSDNYKEDEIPNEFSDENVKTCNTFFYNNILKLINLIPKDVIDTRNEFDLFLNGVEKNYFLTHDISNNQIIPNSLIPVNENTNEISPIDSISHKHEDSVSQETLVGNESVNISSISPTTPISHSTTCNDRFENHSNVNANNSNDEYDMIEREEELKLKENPDYYNICPTDIYINESYECIKKCTKIMMSWNEMSENKNENEIDKFMLLSSKINTNFCKELIRCLENFFSFDYEHNVLLTGCISRLFFIINDEFHLKLFKSEDHTNSLFLQVLKKLSDYANSVSSTIENFTKKLKYVKQEIFFDKFYEAMLDKSFYSESYKDYTKVLDISYEENKFIFSYILLQEFIKEIISIEMAYVMFDSDQDTKKLNHHQILNELKEKLNNETKSIRSIDVESINNSTRDVLNVINNTLASTDETDISNTEKELKEIKDNIKSIDFEEAFMKELEKEEDKEDESDDVTKKIEDINNVIMKSIRENFSDKYSLDLGQYNKENESSENEPEESKINIISPINISNITSSSSNGNNEFNISEDIKKLNALFNNGNISDLVNPFEFESVLMENSSNNNINESNDAQYFMNLRKNSSGSFCYDMDTPNSQYSFDNDHENNNNYINNKKIINDEVLSPISMELDNSMENEEIESRKRDISRNSIDDDNINISLLSLKCKNEREREFQIPLGSESNTEYYKYLRELPASPVLPPTLLKGNSHSSNSSTGSLLDPMENEDDLAYLDYLDKVTHNGKIKKCEGENLNRTNNNGNYSKDDGDKNVNKKEFKNEKINNDEYEDGSDIENEEIVNELIKENEEIISCSSPTDGTITSLNINEDEDDDNNEKDINETPKSRKKSKSRLNSNVEKFFNQQKQKINSIFNHKNNIINPEDIDNIDDESSISLQQNDETRDINDSSCTDFYSETFDETSFLKKNLNTGFGYF